MRLTWMGAVKLDPKERGSLATRKFCGNKRFSGLKDIELIACGYFIVKRGAERPRGASMNGHAWTEMGGPECAWLG